MAIDATYMEYLQRQYGYAEWRASDGADDAVQPVESFTGDAVPGWTLQRTTRRTGDDGVPLLRGIWALVPGSDERLLDVELWSCPSPGAAREYLLRVLGDNQGAVATRGGAGSPGEVSFRLGGDSAITFARGRMVVRVRNAGRKVESVAAEASQLDAWLLGKGRR